MSITVGVWCAALGLLLGPFLAGLTRRVPAAAPILAAGAWRGTPAGRRRTASVTVGSAMALGAIGAAVGARPHLPAYLWLGSVGVVLAVIDLDCRRLPDRLTLPSYPVGLALLAVASAAGADWTALRRALVATLAVGALALLIALAAPGGGLGLGDVKLLGLLGLYLGWLGWGQVVVGVFLGFLIGSVAAVVQLALRRAGWKDEMAFGQWLVAGGLLAVVAGPSMLDAYLSVNGAS